MNLGEFRNQLQIRGFEGFSPQDLNIYINWGYQDVSRLTKWTWEETWVDLSIPVGEYYKTLTADLPTMKSVESVLSISPSQEFQLTPMTDDEFYADWGARDLTSSQMRGEPGRYYLSGTRLYILPPPVEDRLMRVHITQQVVDLTSDGDVPLTPPDYDSAILKASEIWCHDRMRQTEYKREAERDLIRILEDASATDQFRDPEITPRMTRPARWT